MQIIIDGRKVRWQDVDVRELGFGQAVNPSYTYEIQLSREETETLFHEPYGELVASLRKSARRAPGERPEIDRLAALGYPRIRDLFAQQPRLWEYLVAVPMRPYWLYSVFEPDDSYRFVINSVSSVRVAEDRMTIAGEAYPRP